MQDLRRALRALRKEPLFAAVAVLTLGLGVGANTAIFSVVKAVLLDPVPYPASDPDDVLVLTETTHGTDEMGISYPSFKDWQHRSRAFERMAGFREDERNMAGVEEPIRLQVTQVSFGYFEILGVSPLLGRLLTASDDEPSAGSVLVLNHSLWRSRFGSDPGAIGRVVLLDEVPYEIVGVLPGDFEFSTEERAYVALEPWGALDGDAKDRGNHMDLLALGRVKGEVSIEEARVEMETIAKSLEAEYPASNSGVGASVTRLSDRRVREHRETLWTLLGAVSLVLLIACVNVANLLLARAVSRKRVTAIEAALGASRLRLLRQGLTEGLVLAVLGAAAGALFALLGLTLLRELLPTDIPRIDRVAIDGKVLLYTLGISLVTGLLFGSLPAWVFSRSKPSDPLREGGRDTGRNAFGSALLVAEVALATILLVGASLLIRTVYQLTRVNPGFRSDHLLTLELGVPFERYEGEARQALLRRLDEELEAIPGVRSATAGQVLPLGGSRWRSIFIVGDHPVPPRADLPDSIFTPVDIGYFETLSIPLLRGRVFEPRDTAEGPPVVVVNETLARKFWPNENPIGKRLKQGWPEDEGPWHPWREIVGVVADVKQFGVGAETVMQTYIPLAQRGLWRVAIALRTETDPLTVVLPVKSAIRRLDASLPVFDVASGEQAIRSSMAPHRFAMLLLGIFAALALFLAAVGLYGVIAYSVARRTREIGLRMSVGAGRSDVFRLVVRQGMIRAASGAAIGLALGALASRFLESFLFGVTGRDPLTFAVVPLVLLVAAFAASAVPALAASRIDPIRALRYE